jgi:hypothetical protein
MCQLTWLGITSGVAQAGEQEEAKENPFHCAVRPCFVQGRAG